MNQRTDAALLRDYVENRSESAFTELVERYVALVYSVARRVVVDPHLAQDVTQTTFSILAREARHLAGRTFLSSWLHRTAANQAANLVRGEMRRRAREQEAYSMQTASPNTDADWKQIAPMLDAALNKLAEVDRSVILLRFFEKKTAAQIGALLQVSEEAAQKRVVRAVDRLRVLLAGKGATLSSATLAGLVAEQAVLAAPASLATSVSAAVFGGGAAAGGITTTLKLIAMSKLKASAVSALIVAGVATPLVVQHQSLAGFRDENAALKEQVRQMTGWRAENEKMLAQLEAARQSQSLTSAQHSELMRLRNEVSALRRESQELARLRARPEQVAKPAAATLPGYLPATAWANVGAEKPETALQTLFWAGKLGDTNLVHSLLRWQRDTAIPASDEMDKMWAQGLLGGATQFSRSLDGFRVTSQREEATNIARMEVEITNRDGETKSHSLRFVSEDNQWFPVIHVWKEGKGSVRAAMDVPPKFELAK